MQNKTVRIGCVIMASGDSVRFGGGKLTSVFRGRPLASYIMEETAHQPFDCAVVVTRWNEVAQLARASGLAVLLHSQPLVSDTIRLGTQYMSGSISGRSIPDGIMFCVADQPLLKALTIGRMLAEFATYPDSIVRLEGTDLQTGTRRFANPVIFPAAMYKELESLPPDETGRYVIKKHAAIVRTVQAENSLELEDIDTPDQFEKLSGIS